MTAPAAPGGTRGAEPSVGAWGAELPVGAWGVESSVGAWGVESSVGAWGAESPVGALGVESSVGAWGAESSVGALGVESSVGGWGAESSVGAWGAELPVEAWGVESSVGAWSAETPVGGWGVEVSVGAPEGADEVGVVAAAPGEVAAPVGGADEADLAAGVVAEAERVAASAGGAWLVVIDGQRIFADPTSDWGSPMWPDACDRIAELLPRYEGRTILTRWVPPAPGERTGSWDAYMAAWPFADRPASDPLFDLVPELADVPDAVVVDAPTFGKWEQIEAITGPAPQLVIAGVSTDCCVISTVLPAADAGATLTVVTDACAGSTPENHAAACAVMALYPPQVTLTTTAELTSSD